MALKSVALLAGLVALPATTLADTSSIEVVMNQAKIVKLARPADTIVIGNPEIADAAVQDATTIVLTGKGFGVTNLVVLDIDGQPVVDEQVVVSRQTADSVRIYRRANVQTLSCTPYCESAYKTEAERMSEAELNSSQ
ncbi:pilus assembly protein N-terminal domain-containing protein [Nitratireductor aquimarinus]|uniref:pilus assembly protein N-terminal domain-containing protein n=1 Tax=Nitratireductor aquimarinus TaxID=889300 RepID=UPI0029358606|nr:pilus assembly protein N-terminal domain-containing protein [Nitratireductor aquimarinus]MDV2968468.1 pilus assembly protein N-terminal domain-containing protein [Nitratireductor aquimarinus]